MSDQPAMSSAAREREAFLGALERPDPAERAAFLDAACGADHALRAQVEALLRAQVEVGSFLETPALAANNRGAAATGSPGATDLAGAGLEKPGDRIGRYKLLQKIGEGGAGAVYMAEQEEPVRRRVALKVIKLGMDTRSVIARFEAERQALALMDHLNIARVLDAGATETGRPYFVMELVRGVKITDYCNQNNLTTPERLGLFIQVCQAIQHAHQKGVIHRDIKPSNILVTLHDGTPVPKIIDFGIAKATGRRLTDKTLFTEFTSFIGTPAYMSPEQAEMSGLDIDTRSDIYALGVLLYELLTGTTPFDAATLVGVGLDECRRTIREQEPARPSTRLATMQAADLTTTARQRRLDPPKLIHQVSGDLDWIAMKCLEKDRTRRYATAHDVALDIQRYLEGEPVLARPPTTLYRFQKFVRRHHGAFAAVAGIALALLAGTGISAWQAVRATRAEHRSQAAQQQDWQLRRQAERERARAEQKEAAARLNEYIADINLAQQSLEAGNLGRAVQLLDKHRPQPGEADLRGFEWRYLRHLCQGDEHVALPDQGGRVESLAVSPNGQWLAIGAWDKFNVLNLRSRAPVVSQAKGALSMAFFPDGQTLVTASPSTLRVWNTGDWTQQAALEENGGPIALSRDARRVATLSRGGVRVWDTRAWTQLRLFEGARGPVAFSPDGRTLALLSGAGISLRAVDGAAAELVLENSTNVFGFRNSHALEFTPDGKSVVAARNALSEQGIFVLSIWDARSGKEMGTLPNDPEQIEHTGVITCLAFSPDGRTLATASEDRSIRLWDMAIRRRLARLQGHSEVVRAIAFSRDGQTLFSAGWDGAVKSWPTRRQPKEDLLPGLWMPLAFSRDSRTLAAVNRQNTVAFFDLGTREPEDPLQLESPRSRGPAFGLLFSVAISGDLRTVAHGLRDGSVNLWNIETREATPLKVSDRPVELVALSPDARVLITGGRDRVLRCWDVRNGTNTVLESEARQVFFSPDGRTLAAHSRGDTVELWDVPTRLLRTNLVFETQSGFGPPLFAAAFTTGSALLAVAGLDDTIRLWETQTGRLVGTCTGHKQRVASVAFSPDGRTLASAAEDGTLKLWNVATQLELLTLRRLGATLRGMMFSPDGRLLVGSSGFISQSPLAGLRFYRAPPMSETGAGPGG